MPSITMGDTYDFSDWLNLPVREAATAYRSSAAKIRVPRVPAFAPLRAQRAPSCASHART